MWQAGLRRRDPRSPGGQELRDVVRRVHLDQRTSVKAKGRTIRPLRHRWEALPVPLSQGPFALVERWHSASCHGTSQHQDDDVDELSRIEAADELEIAPRRRDGSLRKPVPIWVVRVGDDLYVRAAHGPGSGWHRVARTSREGRIRAGGVEKDVTIEDAEGAVHDKVDAA